MNSEPPTREPVLETLRQAAAVHARHRAMGFMLRAALWLVAAVPILLVADVLMHFSETLRIAGVVAVGIAFLTVFAVAIGLACFAKPPMLRIARLLESRNPELGSKLVNILQLDADSQSESAAPLTRELAKRAVADAGKALDLSSLPPLAREPRLPRRALHAAVALGLLALLSIFGGQHVHNQWLRFVDPYGDHPPFSLTHLEILQPIAGAKVLFGGECTVEVRASGHQPQQLFLTATPIDGITPPVTLPMSARGDGTFVARLENIRHAVELTAHTADEGSRSHKRLLDLILIPQIGSATATIIPPVYTGQKERETPYRFTALQLLEGTKVKFSINSNRPLGEGKMLFEGADPNSVTHPLQPAAEGPGDRALAEIIATQSGRLTFSLVDMEGNAADESPTATLTVSRDQPPAIAITVPEQDALVVEGLSIPIVVDATDDYGLRSMRLHVGINEIFQSIDPVTFDAPDTRRHRLTHTLDLAKAGAKAGDKVIVFAEAVDTRPEPQMTRTATRRMEIITEADYNDRLRQEADVAKIAGKYERLLDRFQEQINEQKRIEEKLAELRKKAAAGEDKEQVLTEFAEAFADQAHLNERLERMAEEMNEFGRENPVYDFEKELEEKLKQQAQAIRESVKENREQAEQAAEKGPPPPEAPSPEMMEEMEKAATAQRERLQGGSDKAEQEIREPLEDLAQLHELMKDFNRFKDLAEEQRELAEQSKAYENKAQLNAEDRLALRDMGARQRDLAQKLDQLEEKLRHDAEAAKEKFPEAATSAEQLADQMDSAGMSGLARKAAQSMLDAKGGDSHAQAKNLQEEMDRLFEEAAQPGQQGLAQGLDRALRLQRGMNPGDSMRQMQLSRNFRPLPSEGQSGAGMGGFMASSAMDANPMMMGGESLMDGAIAGAISGRGDEGGSGQAGAPTAKIDTPDEAKVDAQSARRTTTPGSSTLLMEYEKVADAYFRRLTTQP
ncbi:MAG: hypothetical protein MUF13_05625 [Akkermansiaceae bacterium]|jgi:hypothetical protein|nr:hypothetical protein [Akkermansiaceae bacterium]